VELGTILLEKYRVEEVLGTGGMGRVVRAAHLYLQQQFAIKVLLPHMAESAETVSRFLREAQSTSQLKSEHIARVFDVGKMPDGVPFMVMEYLQGNDLNQILRHHGPQRSQVVCDLMLQACEGMAEAHSLGIVHRDIKPSNFFITTRPDGTMLLKILDFGISKTPVGITELTNNQTVIGTPTYMSPEQMKSGKIADQRSDIWSMGIVMYQMLVGRPPFVGESYPELVIKVGGESPPPIGLPLPAGLEDVILRCLQKNPQLRQQNVGELARMLAPYASDPIQGAQAATRATRTLQQRAGSSHDANPLTAAGGRLTPTPISPAQLTPRSWPPTGGSSLSHARGQVTHTHQVRGAKRGVMIIGVLGLIAGAGIGGFVAKDMLDDDPPAQVSAAPPKEAPAKPDVKPDPALPEAKPDEKTDAKGDPKTDPKTEPKTEARSEPAIALENEPIAARAEIPLPPAKPAAKVEPTPVAKVEPVAKPVQKPIAKIEPTPVAKPAQKPIAKIEPKPVAKPVTKPKPKPRPKPSDDLFDTRK
jgi:serine/threonine-protein kinase